MIPEGVYKFHSVLLYVAYSGILSIHEYTELKRSTMRRKIQ